MWQITIGHLGHFLLEFLAQIWTQGTLRHILGPILVIFDICHGFVSAGDALGREHPATPMSSFLAGHSGCK